MQIRILPCVLFASAAAVLVASVLLLGSAVSQALAAERIHRNALLLAIAGIGIAAGFMKPARRRISRLDRTIGLCALLLPCYALVQMLPLPVWLISIASPARFSLLQGLARISGGMPAFASLSIVPGITFTHFVLIVGYAVVFFSVRALVRSDIGPAWIFALPLIAAALFEVIAASGQITHGLQVQGTYGIKNHFAGLLAMALPFVIASVLASGVEEPLQMGVGMTIGLILLVGIAVSTSRGGSAAALSSAMALALLAFPVTTSIRVRLFASSLAGVVILGAFFYLTPLVLVERLSDHTSSGRIPIWLDTLHLIAAYPVAGCGLGGYESAILQFKTTALLNDLDYAHNDYLQYLAEMGVFGFLIGAVFFGGLFVRTLRACGAGSNRRWLAAACTGSLAAVLTHSFVDFNMYVPANAIVLAWVAGIAAGLPVSEALSAVPSRSTQSRSADYQFAPTSGGPPGLRHPEHPRAL